MTMVSLLHLTRASPCSWEWAKFRKNRPDIQALQDIQVQKAADKRWSKIDRRMQKDVDRVTLYSGTLKVERLVRGVGETKE